MKEVKQVTFETFEDALAAMKTAVAEHNKLTIAQEKLWCDLETLNSTEMAPEKRGKVEDVLYEQIRANKDQRFSCARSAYWGLALDAQRTAPFRNAFPTATDQERAELKKAFDEMRKDMPECREKLGGSHE
jgi:hypothetical protein